MHAHDDRDQFAPPRPPARLRAIVLAVLAHAILIGALTWGVNWKSSADMPAVEAELWSAVPQQAAPRAVEPPPPPPEPVPAPPQPTPAPPPPPPRQAAPDTRQADIALEREKKRLEKEKKELQQQLEREKRERERKEEERRERLAHEKELHEKQLAEQKKLEQHKAEQEKQKKQEKQKQLAEDKKRQAQEDQRKQEAAEKASAKAAEARRQENIRRMQGLAGATGGETATGNAKQSSGPSGSYGGKVAAKVRPNIVYPDAVAGNPRAVVQVRAAPDGTIVGTKLIQSSGNKAWDDAVLRALDKTGSLPRDVDGRVPSTLEIGFRPQD
ncbi:cell envelope integrity protein TolA [Acidovorax soli]|uniref:cell envelope integrity protein TolA n=1 Tax=Acidovorax soli TaxID=592050 RepID=UPI0032B2871A